MIEFGQKRLDSIFTRFPDKRIMVVGDLMIDEYLLGNVSRISPEAPVPVIEVREQVTRLGGAANVALNIAALGCVPVIVGAIGDDFSGDTLLELLGKSSVAADGVVRILGRPTTVKTRIIGDSQHIARVDKEKTDYLNREQEKRILDKIEELLDSVDGLILQDYNKGVLTKDLITKIIDRAANRGIIITVDPKFKYFLNYQKVTVFKPNIKETARMILKGAAFEPMAELRKFTASLLTPTIRSEMARRKRTPTMRI